MPPVNFDPLEMAERLEPSVRRAFLRSVADMKNEAQQFLVIRAIQDGDIEGAIQLLNIRAELFEPFRELLRASYIQGGQAAMMALPRMQDPLSGGPLVARFDGRNPRAERWINDHSSKLIVEITEDARNVVRERLQTVMSEGVDAKRAARELIGRYDRVARRRVGGTIGLNSQRQRAVVRAFDELRSGDPAQMQNYLTRRLRDRRFDATVKKAIAEGKPVNLTQAQAARDRYADRHLQRRGEDIARTELLQSMHSAQSEGLNQLVDNQQLKPQQITREWDAANDSATRTSHRFMDGQKVQGTQTPFISGDGNYLLHPGDGSYGAPASEIINCRCRVSVSIDFLQELTPEDALAFV